MNLGITGVLYGLRRSGALPQYQGALPQPRAGVENAMIAWAQPRRPTIVNSNRFFPWYIQLSGGNRVNIRENRTGIQYGDTFLQGRIHNLRLQSQIGRKSNS